MSMITTPSKRWFTMVPTAALALVVLAACGGQQAAPEAPKAPAESTTAPAETSTEAPAMTEASPAAETATEAAPAATEAAPAMTEASPAAATTATEAAPAASTTEATPAAKAATEASPAAATTTEATPAAAGSPAASASGGSASAQEFTISSHDIYFEPKELTIPADTDVKVLLPNQGAAPHNFSIDALKISVDMAPGEEKDATINAPAGEYEYYCNVPGHKQAGMVGKLTVK